MERRVQVCSEHFNELHAPMVEPAVVVRRIMDSSRVTVGLLILCINQFRHVRPLHQQVDSFG